MGFFSALRTLPMRRPFIFGVGLAGTKNGLCDILVQMTVEEKEMVDWTRTSVFVTFGLLFNGAWQYALFVKMMPRVCPNAVSRSRILCNVLCSIFWISDDTTPCSARSLQ